MLLLNCAVLFSKSIFYLERRKFNHEAYLQLVQILDKVLLQERFFNACKPMEFLFLSERKVGCEKCGKIDI